MSEETILSQPKAAVILVPKRGLGGKFAWAMGGLITRGIQTGKFLDTFKKGEVEAGDIKDITDRMQKVQELSLTGNSIVVRYRRGTVFKKDRAVALPLQYAKSVQEKGALAKWLEVEFVVPGEEKPAEFTLRLSKLKQRDVWLRELSRIISSPVGF